MVWSHLGIFPGRFATIAGVTRLRSACLEALRASFESGCIRMVARTSVGAGAPGAGTKQVVVSVLARSSNCRGAPEVCI